jgi:hypothetical protein
MAVWMVLALALVAPPRALALVSYLPAGQAPSEKEARTPAQQKINSQLLYEIYRRRGEDKQKGIPPGATDVRIDSRGRALVDVRAVPVSRPLQKRIRDLDGAIVSVSAAQNSILAWVSLLKLEQLAQETAVRFIEPAAEAKTAAPTNKR